MVSCDPGQSSPYHVAHGLMTERWVGTSLGHCSGRGSSLEFFSGWGSSLEFCSGRGSSLEFFSGRGSSLEFFTGCGIISINTVNGNTSLQGG